MLQKRVIPVIQVSNGKHVKTRQFKNPVYIGSPVNSAQVFYSMGVHELAIINIDGKLDLELLKRITKNVFIPVSYGGGVRSVEDATRVIQEAGCEKVIVNSEAVTNEKMIKKMVDEIGSQSVVASIDHDDKNKARINHGKNVLPGGAIFWALKAAREWKCGEILMNSVQRDGMMDGYNLEMIKYVTMRCTAPVVALGGAGTRDDLKEALNAGAQGAAAGSLFCFKDKNRQNCLNYVEERIT